MHDIGQHAALPLYHGFAPELDDGRKLDLKLSEL